MKFYWEIIEVKCDNYEKIVDLVEEIKQLQEKEVKNVPHAHLCKVSVVVELANMLHEIALFPKMHAWRLISDVFGVFEKDIVSFMRNDEDQNLKAREWATRLLFDFHDRLRPLASTPECESRFIKQFAKNSKQKDCF